MQKKGPDLKQIIKSCLSNEAKAEQLFYKTFYGYLSGVAYRYVKQREIINEIVNDSFVKIFCKLKDFHFEGGEPDFTKVFKTWIGRITANTAIDKMRANKTLIYVEEVPKECIIEMVVQPINKLAFDDINILLNQLPDLHRIIFNMHAIEGFSHEEIGKQLNMLPNTSRVYLKRARAKLVGLYQAEENE